MVVTNQKPSSVEENAVICPETTPASTDLARANLSTQTFTVSQSRDRPVTIPRKTTPAPTVDAERTVLHLPGDWLKTPTTPYQPKYCALTFPEALVATLQTHVQTNSVDERALLLAAFSTLLYRYTQQETIALSLLLSDHTSHQTSPRDLYMHLNGTLSGRELVAQMSTTLQTLPTTVDLGETTGVQRSPLPLAVTFITDFFRVEGKEQWLTDFQGQTPGGTEQPDLHLFVLQQPHSRSVVLRYNANLFLPETIQRLAGHLQVLLASLVHNPACALAQLPLLTEAETEQFASWQSDQVEHPAVPLQHYMESHAQQQPHAIALRFQDQQLTYAALNERANQLAHYLIALGVGAEVRVAVCVEPSFDIAVSLLGIFKAGGVYVPLDPTYPTDRLTVILEETQPQVLLTQSHLLGLLPLLAAHSFCFDQDSATLQPLPTHNPATVIDLEQTSHLIYTSGTTGQPKGVMNSYGNLVQYILVAKERYGFNQQDVMPAIARYTFSITMFELLSPLVAGGTLVILERAQLLDFQRLTQTLSQLTVLHASPSLLQKLVAYIADNELDRTPFQRLRHVSTGGDLVPAALLDALQRVFTQAELFVIYGCSEVSCMGCTYPVTRAPQITQSRVGQPFPNVSVCLYDAQQNRVPIGVPGEIYIGGAGVTKGYWQRAALTAEKFITLEGQRFYRTGDVGRLDADGHLEMLGRSDFQIKLRGMRIELGEIEATLRQVPGVREGVVTARTLWHGEPGLVAYVVLDQAKTTTEAMRSYLQAKLPDYMVPAAFVVLDALPVNINQKVDRRALPAPTQTRPQPIEQSAPTSKLEQQLIEIWEQTLNVRPINVKENFFDLGGHSLLAFTLLAQIEQTIGKRLSITALYQAPTIETLALAIGKEDGSVACQSLMVIQPGSAKPPLFCIHVLGRGLKFYRPLAKCLSADQPLYGLSVQIVDRDQAPPNRVEALAAYYIKEMQMIQPEGPYYLSGVSFGGVVAFEIAQQLQQQGQAVKLLAMLDTDGPGAIASASVNEKLSTHWNRFLQDGLSYAFKKAADKVNGTIAGWRETLDHSYKKLACQYYLRRQLLLPEALNDFAFAEEHHQASNCYTPQPYSGEIVLFRATDRDLGVGELLDAQLGWGKFAIEGVQAFDVPGNHLTMLQEPNAHILAEQLKEYLP